MDNAPQPAVPAPESLIKSVLNAPLSAALAFAIVLFAAGSVASMSAITYPEIAMGTDTVTVHMASAHSSAETMVLGDSTTVSSTAAIDDLSLEAADPSVSMAFKPVSFNSNGRWNYKIMYYTRNLTGAGQISIGTFVLAQNLSATGTLETGAILKPDHEYKVSFWQVNSDGSKAKIQSQVLHTQKASSKTNPCENNSLLCPPILPKPCTVNSTSTPGSAGINCPPRPCYTTSTGTSGSESNKNCYPLPPCPVNATSTPSGSTTTIHCIPLPLPCSTVKGSEHPCVPPVVCPLGQNCPGLPTSTSTSNKEHK